MPNVVEINSIEELGIGQIVCAWYLSEKTKEVLSGRGGNAVSPFSALTIPYAEEIANLKTARLSNKNLQIVN
jgi:hypothetical protein